MLISTSLATCVVVTDYLFNNQMTLCVNMVLPLLQPQLGARLVCNHTPTPQLSTSQLITVATAYQPPSLQLFTSHIPTSLPPDQVLSHLHTLPWQQEPLLLNVLIYFLTSMKNLSHWPLPHQYTISGQVRFCYCTPHKFCCSLLITV